MCVPGLRFLAPTNDFRFDSFSESFIFENDRPIASPYVGLLVGGSRT